MSRTFEYRGSGSTSCRSTSASLPANRRTSLPKRYLRRPSAPRSHPTAPCPVAGLLQRSSIRRWLPSVGFTAGGIYDFQGGIEGGEAGLVHAIPRVALVILGVAAFHRVEVLDEVIPGGLHQIAGQQGDDHPPARHGAPTALVSRRSRRLPSELRSDHWRTVIGDFIELFGHAHSQ